MKFTDGFWLIRKGYQVFHPREAYDVEAASASLLVTAPTKFITDRELTHDVTVLFVELSAYMDDVIRVRITHFAGEKRCGPRFEIAPHTAGSSRTRVDEDTATLESGRLVTRVDRKKWRIEFGAAGRSLTGSRQGGMGYVVADDGATYVHEQLSLGVGERVYGMGERFTAFVKNGQTVEIWNRDGGTSSEQAYKNVPFYITDGGYGVFVNNPGHVSCEVASENVSCVQFSVQGESLEYFLIYGPTPKEILSRYTALTGRPALPPAWSFGLWLSTSFTTPYDEATVTAMVRQMRDKGIPLSVFHFDSFWMREFEWCGLRWDERTFPEPRKMLVRLKDMDLRICLWLNPYIAQRSELFAEAKERGYLIRKPNGDVWQTDLWQPGMGVVDFTNPEARKWFSARLDALTDMGVDAFKADFGERIPTDVAYHDGSDPQGMHNFFTFLYNRTVFEALHERRGEAVLFAQSATAGCQRFPVHWGGDCLSSYESMAESLRGGLSLGLSGFGFWSHDIGGFEGMPSTDLYKRWIAFGLLSSHSRLHGSSSYRVPWLFDEESVEVLRFFTRLKCRLMPYLYQGAVEASRSGVPLMRAMLVEFPEDPTCGYLDRQYMLGPSLLVAPVFSADGAVEFYLPGGTWTHLLSGETRRGPGWFSETYGYLSLPLFVREGSLLAMGSRDDRPDYAYADAPLLRLYAPEQGMKAAAEIPAATGESACRFEASRRGEAVEVSCAGKSDNWRVLLVGARVVSRVSGGSAKEDADGTLITPESGLESVRFEIP